MTTTQAVTVHDVLEDAADTIVRNGYCRSYMYDTRQAETGLPLEKCKVDLVGAINMAVHGTPRYVGGNPLIYAAEQAVTARTNAPSLVAWCSRPGNGKQQAIQLLRDTAAELRAEAA